MRDKLTVEMLVGLVSLEMRASEETTGQLQNNFYLEKVFEKLVISIRNSIIPLFTGSKLSC